MYNKSLVSVIIPFLNAEQFIQETIGSVLAQTYGHWELLLVDDGSTDRSTDLAQQYAVRNPQRISYLEHPEHQNRGISASRNLGLSQAKGEFIAFLDADDIWFPHKLERQVAILSAQPEAAMTYGTTQYWFSWTGNPEDKHRDYIQRHGIQPDVLVQPPALLTSFLRGKAAIPPPCSILVRHEVFTSSGRFEESFRGMYEDQVFYAKICLRSPVFVASECGDRYRQHANSLCSVVAHNRQTHSAHLRYLYWLRAYLLQGGFEGTEVWPALQKELRYYQDPGRLSVSNVTRYLVRRSRKLWSRMTARPFPVRTLH